MSFKTRLAKMAIQSTPKKLVTWVANQKLKGIAVITDFDFDLDSRKAYAKTMLYGEDQAIEVWLEDFAVINEGHSYQFILEKAKANRPWLDNLLSRIAGRTWNIPVTPELEAQFGFVLELFQAKPAVQGRDENKAG